MSFPQFPPPATPASGQQPSAAPTYPYGTYHPPTSSGYSNSQTPSTYPNPYQGASYPTGLSGYGAWPYPYSYVQQHPQTAYARGSSATATVPGVNSASISTAASAPPRSTTFSSYTPSYLRESTTGTGSGGPAGRGSRKQFNFKGLFSKELKNLMYGFGDDRNPATDTVSVMEEILVGYITDVCQTAGASSRKTRLSVEDLRRVLARPADAKKLARMEELLFMQEDIKRARAQFEESDITQTKEF